MPPPIAFSGTAVWGSSWLLCAACLLSPTLSHAQTPSGEQPTERRLWRDSWPDFSWVEGLVTVAAGATTLAIASRPPAREARWEGGVLFDDAVRDVARLDATGARQRARRIGDLTYFAAPVIPLLIDPLLVAWGVHGDRRAAFNVGWMGLEAFSYTGLLSFVSLRSVARERPDSSECRHQQPNGGCGVDTESFWSGHTSITAASAGLVCANHSRMPLWGHPVADAGACVLASVSSLTTGVTRLVGDRHYATDVLLGWGVGFGIGYGVPVLLHYSRTKTGLALSIAPCNGSCLSVRGSF